MAKKKERKPGWSNGSLDEVALAGMTREQLSELAATYEIAITETASDEYIIKAILKAESEAQATTGDDPAAVETTQDNGGDNPPANPAPAKPPSAKGSGAKKRLKCIALKGASLSIGDGIVKVGDDGTFEVEEKEAARLLTIPGYEEA